MRSFPSLLLTGVLSVGLWACTSEETPSTSGSSSPPATAQAQGESIPFRFVDGLTGQAITEPLQVTFKGAVPVKNASGQTLNNQTLAVSEGSLTVFPDFSKGANFTLLVGNRSRGIVETGVLVDGHGSFSVGVPFDVPLIKTSDTAIQDQANSGQAITVAKRTIDLQVDGSLPAATLITSSKMIESSFERFGVADSTPLVDMGTAGITILAGTRALDAQGRPFLPTGPLTVTAIHYSGMQREVLQRFPGGFATPVEGTLPAGSARSGEGVFITGGFSTFNITDALGRAIKRFDRNLDMWIDTPKVGRDPLTGQPRKAGGAFPVYSFDESTGQWTFESLGQIAEKQPFNAELFQVRFSANHLTSWNLDDYVEKCVVTLALPAPRDAVDILVLGNSTWPFYIPHETLIEGLTQPADPTKIRVALANLNAAYRFFDVDDMNESFGTVYSQRIEGRYKDTKLIFGQAFHSGSCDTEIPVTPLPETRPYSVKVNELCASPTRLAQATDVRLTLYGKHPSAPSTETILYRKNRNFIWENAADSRTQNLGFDLARGAVVERIELHEFNGTEEAGNTLLSIRPVTGMDQFLKTQFDVSYSLATVCNGTTGPPNPPVTSTPIFAQ
ncbi:MAG: hypothetical protein QE278_14770 [Limnobacter sp.]|nr:hypothetical protein [Limnobacter sp.]